MKTSCIAYAALLLMGSMFSSAGPSFAQSPPDHPGGAGPHEHHDGEGPPGSGAPHFAFAHHDFGHFTPIEHSNWVAGRWQHGWHDGHFGWWWLAGGGWFFYDTPVYPYPDYVSDYYDYDEDYGPAYPGQYWYYCSNPPGYYPYVQYCSVPWQPVPAAPPESGYGPGPQPNGNMPPASGQPGSYGAPGQNYPPPPPPASQQGPGGPPPPGSASQPPQPPPQGPGDQGPPPGYPDTGPGDQPLPPPGNYNGPN